jgi:hypothetical protein
MWLIQEVIRRAALMSLRCLKVPDGVEYSLYMMFSCCLFVVNPTCYSYIHVGGHLYVLSSVSMRLLD